MQYWINQNGVQTGPVALDQLEKMNVSADAYVWRNGLEDWVKITSLPELASVIGEPTVAMEQPLPTEQTVEEPAEEIIEQLVEEPAEEPVEEPVEEPIEEPVEGYTHPAEPTVIPEIPIAEQTNQETAPTAPVVGMPVAWQQPQQATPRPECPPTNLVWAILTLVLCCMPLSIVAIVYSTKVTKLYNAGDYAGANRASEKSAWWCIASIIGSIVLSPFVTIIQMIIQSQV